MARVAPAAQSILDQATYFRPKRSKRSDGTIGDRSHRRRPSDHNPDSRGVVHAADLTHDPARGMDAHGWARWLASKRDPRVKYIISNRQIWTPQSGKWVKYSGSNPHVSHVHVSVIKSRENDTSPWFDGWLYNMGLKPIIVSPTPAPAPATGNLPIRKALNFGEKGRLVDILQWELAVASGARFSGEEGAFGFKTAQAIINLGKMLGKDWNGTFVGPDQWAAVDFIYMVKGQNPILS